MEFVKNNREDYTEYEVHVTVWKDFEGNSVAGEDPQLAGFVTKFGAKKWAFRTANPFFTDVLPTDTFESRAKCMETVVETLRRPNPVETELTLDDIKRMFPIPRIKNNKKRTRGRKIQYVPIKDRKGNVVSTKKIVHR